MESLADFLAWPLFKVGDVQATAGSLLAIFAVILATALIARLVSKALQAFFTGTGTHDEDSARGYGVVAQLLVWLVGIEIALQLLGLRLTTLFAAGGFLAVGAGFAAKNIVENILSGSMLRIEKTIRPGDLLIINEQWITIARIGARLTVANTFDGEEVLIPNTLIAQSVVVNLTRHDRFHRINTLVGVSYDSDLKLVRRTLEETIDKLEWRSSNISPFVWLTDFGDSTVNYKVFV